MSTTTTCNDKKFENCKFIMIKKKGPTQTKLEKRFAKKVERYCLQKQTTPWIICSSFGYTNMQAIGRFLTGEGTISAQTMGLIDEYMKKNK